MVREDSDHLSDAKMVSLLQHPRPLVLIPYFRFTGG